uniref:Uncharacterized protein n=1 Tax=Trichobilharzia regenti TaxID=157069 RepID=A0AA85IWW8_TRIRE|nr:unnamed protein product [Trichobilharzia regenti]
MVPLPANVIREYLFSYSTCWTPHCLLTSLKNSRIFARQNQLRKRVHSVRLNCPHRHTYTVTITIKIYLKGQNYRWLTVNNGIQHSSFTSFVELIRLDVSASVSE